MSGQANLLTFPTHTHMHTHTHAHTHTCTHAYPPNHTPHHTYTHTEYRDAFALFDKRGDGKIDSDQVGDVLRALNLNPTEVEVKKIVQEIDPNGRS